MRGRAQAAAATVCRLSAAHGARLPALALLAGARGSRSCTPMRSTGSPAIAGWQAAATTAPTLQGCEHRQRRVCQQPGMRPPAQGTGWQALGTGWGEAVWGGGELAAHLSESVGSSVVRCSSSSFIVSAPGGVAGKGTAGQGGRHVGRPAVHWLGSSPARQAWASRGLCTRAAQQAAGGRNTRGRHRPGGRSVWNQGSAMISAVVGRSAGSRASSRSSIASAPAVARGQRRGQPRAAGLSRRSGHQREARSSPCSSACSRSVSQGAHLGRRRGRGAATAAARRGLQRCRAGPARRATGGRGASRARCRRPTRPPSAQRGREGRRELTATAQPA